MKGVEVLPLTYDENARIPLFMSFVNILSGDLGYGLADKAREAWNVSGCCGKNLGVSAILISLVV